MKKRIFTSVAIVIVLALLFVLKVYVSDYFFDAFFVIVACFAAYEMSRLLTKFGRYNFTFVAVAFPTLLLAVNLVGLYLVDVFSDELWVLYSMLIDIALIVLVACLLFLWSLIRRKRTLNEITVRGIKNISVAKFSLKKALHTAIVFIYPSFLFLCFLFINHFNILPLSKTTDLDTNISVFIILTAILIPMITDTFAMLTGSLIGGKKLCPKISPNKTISGSVGGTLWCVLFAVCIYLIFGCIESFQPFIEIFPIWAYLLIVLFGSCIAQAGDLFESIIKRRADVSDSGTILPGHGGMLDRIDSYIYIAPYILIAFWIFAL